MYNNKANKILLALLIFVFLPFHVFSAQDSLSIMSPNYFGEEDNIFDYIHYLENEPLSFKFCSDEGITNLEFNLICSDGNKTALKLNDLENTNCYFSNFDLDKTTCSEFDLKINYEKDNKLKEIVRHFKKQKESKLVNHILEKDYTTLSLEEVSYYLLVLNNIQDKDNLKNMEVYDYLKTKRDNNEKCWPSGNCNLDTTTTILNNLELAGYPLESRLIQDGKIYLEKNQISDLKGSTTTDSTSSKFELVINNEFSSNEEISCDLNIDNGDEERSYIFDENSDWSDLTILKNINNEFSFDCDANLDSIEVRSFEDKLESKEYNNENKVLLEISDSNKNNFNDIDYVLRFNHTFGSGEEINCDISIDGTKDSYTFDENSSKEDLFFEGQLDNDINIDCDANLDFIYLDLYGNLKDEVTHENKDSLQYTLNSNSGKLAYNFELDMDYDFSYNEKLVCDLNLDSGSDRTYTFDENDQDNIKITGRSASEKVSISCDKELKNLDFKLFDIYDRMQIKETKDNVKSFSYSIPSDFSDYSCIGKDNVCDFTQSLSSLRIYGSGFKENSKIDKYLESLIQESNDEFYIDDENKILDTSDFLLYKNNNDLIDFIKFSQNNDGSWGENSKYDRVISSSKSVLGLKESSTSNLEYIDDGEKWIYFNEPISGWGSVEKNSLSYLAIKDTIKPYLKITSFNEIKNEVELELYNPTIYDIRDLKLLFDKDTSNLLKYKEDLGDLGSEETIKVNISTNGDIVGIKSSNMKIIGYDKNKNKIDFISTFVNIVGPDLFDFKTEKAFISSDNPFVKLDYTNNVNNFVATCNYKNPFSNQDETVLINSAENSVNIPDSTLTSGNYTLKFDCDNAGKLFSVSTDVEVEVVEKSFNLDSDNILINSADNFSISLNSTLKDKQTLNFEIKGDLQGIVVPTEDAKIIAGNDVREIFFEVTNPTYLELLGNTSKSELIISSSEGYSKIIPITIDFQVSSKTGNSNWTWIIISIIALWVIIFSIRRYRQNQDDAYNNQADSDDDILLDDMEFQ